MKPRVSVAELPADDRTASTLLAPAPAAAAASVPIGKSVKTLRRPALPTTLVLGAGGGAGVTTLALGLAAAAATRPGGGADAVAVDATAWGGDLGRRGSDVQVSVSNVQTWLTMPGAERISAIIACTGRSSTGVRILSRTPDPLPRGHSMLSVRRNLETAGLLPVFDGGGSVANRGVASLIDDPRIGLVIVAAARADSLNALNDSLVWLTDRYGEYLISNAVIAVTYQLPGGFGAGAVEHVRTHLSKWVRAVVDIPYDRHLATRAPLAWGQLTEPTRLAFRAVLGGIQ
ncbi:hypothetical protein [Nocardia yamanashiensis]|uniref:hypothetical protein n=1 Tax=Nocardia yamanashiensis TaxID=209247 RepID=UPI0008297937|nr:hypothetical protein [Nocardia yamanashiensis]